MDLLQCSLTFQRVVDEGSMAAAARILDLSPSVISKRLNWLEKQLGVQLLKRTTRRLSLTEAGASFYQRSSQLSIQWQALLDETSSASNTPRGILRVGAPQASGCRFIASLMDDFLIQYTELELELLVVKRQDIPNLQLDLFISPEREDFNLASFIGRRLFSYHMKIFAAPEYLKKHPKITSVSDLSKHSCLSLRFAEQHAYWEFESGEQVQVSSRFRSTNHEALIAAAIKGRGLIMLPQILIKKELSNNELVEVLPEKHSPVLHMYAYYPKLDYMPAKLRLFIDFLIEKLS